MKQHRYTTLLCLQTHSPGRLVAWQPVSRELQCDEKSKEAAVGCVCVTWTDLILPAGHVGRHGARDLTGDGGGDQLLTPFHMRTCGTGQQEKFLFHILADFTSKYIFFIYLYIISQRYISRYLCVCFYFLQCIFVLE